MVLTLEITGSHLNRLGPAEHSQLQQPGINGSMKAPCAYKIQVTTINEQ